MSIYGLGANLSFDSAASFMALDEQRMALSDQVAKREIANGPLSAAETAQVAQLDKVLTLKSQRAKINYEVGLAMEEQEKAMRKKERELREKAKAAGILYG